MPLFRRREPLHEQLAREGGLRPPASPAERSASPHHALRERYPVEAFPVAMHGIARPREWDAVASAHAPSARGDFARFVVVDDGAVVVESGAGVDELAAAAAATLEPPVRVEAVRNERDVWSLALWRTAVADLPELEGEELTLTVVAGERRLLVDGAAVAAIPAQLEDEGDYVIEGSRLDGSLWELKVTRL